jgi:hypothetical protein
MDSQLVKRAGKRATSGDWIFVVFDYFSHLCLLIYNLLIFMIQNVKMSLFDNLSDVSSNCDIDFEIWEDTDESDDGPDEVCPSDSETSPPSPPPPSSAEPI